MRGRDLPGPALKLGVSALMLTWLFWRTDLQRVGSLLGGLDLRLWTLCLLAYLASQVLSAYRWQRLLVAKALPVGLGRLVSLTYAGLFFNLLLPTSLGGDVYKGYGLYRQVGHGSEAAASVLLDRLTGLAALLLIALAAVAVVREGGGPEVTATVVMLGAGFFGGAALLRVPAARRLLLGLLARLRLGPVGQALQRVSEAILGYAECGRALLLALLISFGVQTISIGIFYGLSLALRQEIPLAAFCLFIPLGVLAGMLPISLGGLGVREGAFVLLFTRVGVSPAGALALSLAWFLMVLAAGLIGGGIFVLTGPGPLAVSRRAG
ncbi:MAG: flippase-like domain-containing protein [Deltaproteobacteria bacterium]|nr:flippase-like domain-containing protein [Deltaproteobacteria bacterium]